MRQPQLMKASSGMKCASGRKIAAARIWPACTPWRVKEAKKPRRPKGACSTIIERGAGDLAGDGEALDEAEEDEEGGREDADLGVGGQEADGERREAHQEHAEDEHVLAAVGVAPVAEDEGADRAGDVADAVGGERGDDRRPRVFRGEEDLREDEGRGRRVDEEVVVLERRADPAAGGGLSSTGAFRRARGTSRRSSTFSSWFCSFARGHRARRMPRSGLAAGGVGLQSVDWQACSRLIARIAADGE